MTEEGEEGQMEGEGTGMVGRGGVGKGREGILAPMVISKVGAYETWYPFACKLEEPVLCISST